MYLLDTNVISELRHPRPHGGVLAWRATVADRDLYLSAATIGEIQTGIERTRDIDVVKAMEIERWALLLIDTFNLLPMDAETFRIWAHLMHRRSRSLYMDAMIAATAEQHRLTVVTRNVCDFVPFQSKVLNPFLYS